jgi:hypothetical protein
MLRDKIDKIKKLILIKSQFHENNRISLSMDATKPGEEVSIVSRRVIQANRSGRYLKLTMKDMRLARIVGCELTAGPLEFQISRKGIAEQRSA